MRSWLLGAAIVVSLPVLFVVIVVLASESGEVAVLRTATADGGQRETRVWVVDYEGEVWLRSGSPDSRWYADLVAQAEIAVERNGGAIRATAHPDVAMRDVINEQMNAKYGFADDIIGWAFGRGDAIPIRVVPL